MGDRSNIVVKEGNERVYLYSHWGGYEAAEGNARKGLRRAPDRWRDAPYLTRVIFCCLVEDDREGTTGYGVWPTMGDNEHPLVVVDIDKQEVYTTTEKGTPSDPIKAPIPFSTFAGKREE